MSNRKGVKQPLRWLMRVLSLIACGTCINKGFGVVLDGRPPKFPLEKLKSSDHAWMAVR